MSTDDPRKPRPRRRIAGERRAPRTDEVRPRTDEVRPRTEEVPPRTDEPRPVPTVSPTRGLSGDSRPARPLREGPSWLLVGALGALALLLLATVAVLGLGVWDYREVREQDRVDEASREAPVAAERASTAILSYSYTSLDADEKAAKRYMSPAYAKKYAETFDRLVRPNAAKVKAKVEAEVKASGVAHADAARVNVLLYVNQTTTSTANGGEPQVALNRVQLSMVERDGRWLVNDITSY